MIDDRFNPGLLGAAILMNANSRQGIGGILGNAYAQYANAITQQKKQKFDQQYRQMQMNQMQRKLDSELAQSERLASVREANPDNMYAQVDPAGWLQSQASLKTKEQQRLQNMQDELMIQGTLQNLKRAGDDRAQMAEMIMAKDGPAAAMAYLTNSGLPSSTSLPSYTDASLPQSPSSIMTGADYATQQDIIKDAAKAEIKIEADKKAAQIEAQAALPKMIADAQRSITVIDQMIGSEDGQIKEHPGFRGSVGWQANLPNIVRAPAGSAEAGFDRMLEQVKGKVFMEAYQGLKGGGQITEIEGRKAEQAITRMDNALSETDFIVAAREFQDIVRRGLERAKQKAGVGPLEMQQPQGGWSIRKK